MTFVHGKVIHVALLAAVRRRGRISALPPPEFRPRTSISSVAHPGDGACSCIAWQLNSEFTTTQR